MYKLTNTTLVIRLVDNVYIPNDPANNDYAAYLKWVDEGNTPLPIDPLTPEQIFANIENAIQTHIHTVAQQDGWDNQTTCMTRAGYINPWQTKAIAYANWVDACWVHTLTEKDKIIAGTRLNVPTPEEAVAELPTMVWPA